MPRETWLQTALLVTATFPEPFPAMQSSQGGEEVLPGTAGKCWGQEEGDVSFAAPAPLPCHRSSYVTSAESLWCHQTLQRARKHQTLRDRDCPTLNSIHTSNLPEPSPNKLGSLLRRIWDLFCAGCKSLLPASSGKEEKHPLCAW